MLCAWIFFAAFVSATGAVSVVDITGEVCKRNDPNFNACLKRVANDIRPVLRKGVRQLKIPSLDPMVIPKVELKSGDGPVSLNSSFTNVHVQGLSDFDLQVMNVDFNNKVINFVIVAPELNLKSHYVMNGRILSLPITGDGDSKSKYTKATSTMKLKFRPEIKNGQEYWKLESNDINIDVDRADLKLDNLFNGNKQLGDTMNTFIAENWKAVYHEMKPAVEEVVKALINDTVFKLFDTFSIDELFPPQ